MSTRPLAPAHVGREIVVRDPPRLAGFRLRHYRGPVDHPGMIRVVTAVHEAAGIVERVSVEGMDNEYANLHNCDPYRDVIVGEVDGRIAGYGRVTWGDNTDGAREYTSFCFIDPAVRRQGVGRAMLEWQEARLREIAATHTTDRPRYYFSFVYDRDRGGLALLQSSGYTAVRRGAEMVRPTLDAIPTVPMPDGVELRTASASDTRRLWDAMAEVFQDHWGVSDSSEESYAGFVGSPRLDPSLWAVGWAGDEIAGFVITSISDGDLPGEVVGYLDPVGVRRPWRRRGLGRALVAASLRLLASRGATTAGLGVDLQNQNEAARLYESAGFRVQTTSTEFRKELSL